MQKKPNFWSIIDGMPIQYDYLDIRLKNLQFCEWRG